MFIAYVGNTKELIIYPQSFMYFTFVTKIHTGYKA